ncbi:hypothetical protein EPN28_00730 [Patescibacteria group bacterium]|nr:MAG: hypothetical protein EPN28_00730 [Patescibacteria group bacterium]
MYRNENNDAPRYNPSFPVFTKEMTADLSQASATMLAAYFNDVASRDGGESFVYDLAERLAADMPLATLLAAAHLCRLSSAEFISHILCACGKNGRALECARAVAEASLAVFREHSEKRRARRLAVACYTHRLYRAARA